MSILKIFKNKFFIVTIIFLVWIVFFAQYDLLSLFRQREELNEMKAKINYLEKEVLRLENEKTLIKSDTATMERYAREKYFMKTPHEEVFVFDTIESKSVEKK